ncbi:hypothetical protein KKR89_01710 [Cellulomonas dongxiuzhuiae]|uniref:DUF3592 domain-containing protein n=1 Tax=Cellulomonas dongxiuzhuiae TaxID=2819979 RepID=A0ABX8GJR9_9CELL|nr:hypothetical protein [Cellulomonas dongxiuzhuiae]QWC16418.1 hypothetical protein KKR89_01710 [Cellulomonas dongxiuzhuiae]
MRCDEHAAAWQARRDAEREVRRRRALAAEARRPWQGAGARLFGWALLTTALVVVCAARWTAAADVQGALGDGFGTTTATVVDRVPGGRGSEGSYVVTFTVGGERHEADLTQYDGSGPDVGDTIRIDYATSRPGVVRQAGYDSAGLTQTYAVSALAAAAATAALAARWAVVRRRAAGPEATSTR